MAARRARRACTGRRFLAVPEHAYPAAKATYEAMPDRNTKTRIPLKVSIGCGVKGGRTVGRQGRRTSSLHMDVSFLACPEFLYLAAKATYGAPKAKSPKYIAKKKATIRQPFLITSKSNRLLTTTASALVYVFPAHCAEEHLVPALVAPRY